MAMHQGLDLSRFKRISTDKDSSTLRHSKGHEIKIAHSGLSDKMREHLNSMPLHLAEGGGADKAKEDEGNPIRNWLSKGIESITGGAVAPSAPAPSPEPEQPEELPEESPSEALAYQQPAPQPQAPAVAQPAPDPEQPAQQQPMAPNIDAMEQDSLAKKLQEQMQYSQDLAVGKIAPKAYKDLFADKSTLGKIGTIFGMLLSGAGSGLAQQPNLLMDMMNKEIERDFEMQKQNKEGARNFLNLQYQHNLMQSQARAHDIESTIKGMKAIPEAVGASEYLKSQNFPGADDFSNKYRKKIEEILYDSEGKAKMYSTVAQHLSDISVGNPAATAMVAQKIIPAANAMAQKTIADGHKKAHQIAVQHASDQSQKHVQRMPAVNNEKLSKAFMAGDNNKSGYAYAGAIKPEDKQTVKDEVAALTTNRNNLYDWDDSFRKIADMTRAGQTPGVSNSIAGAGAGLGAWLTGGLGAGVGGTLGHAVGNITQNAFERQRNVQKEALKQRIGKQYSADERENIVDAMLPAWNDMQDPKRLAEVYRKGAQHFHSQEVTPILDVYDKQIKGLKTPFPDIKYEPRKAENKKKK